MWSSRISTMASNSIRNLWGANGWVNFGIKKTVTESWGISISTVCALIKLHCLNGVILILYVYGTTH